MKINKRVYERLQQKVFEINSNRKFLYIRPIKETESKEFMNAIESSIQDIFNTVKNRKPEIYVVPGYAPKFHEEKDKRYLIQIIITESCIQFYLYKKF